MISEPLVEHAQAEDYLKTVPVGTRFAPGIAKKGLSQGSLSTQGLLDIS
jgi:hypothetical protein